MRQINHRLFMAAAGGAVLLAGLVSTAVPASAAGPKLTVKPTKNLTGGQTVSVSGKGFTKGDQVYVIECVIGETSTSGSGCNISGLVGPETISSKGVLSKVSFTVQTGAIGSQGGTCGTSKANEKDCDISVGNPSGGDSATEDITFKA